MWYVIWSLTGREEELIDRIHELVPADYYSQVWTPYRIKLRRRDGIDEKISLKMFPGYVFIDTERPEDIHEIICREPDYISFLKTDDKYASISDSERDIITFFTGESGTAGVSLGIIRDGKTYIMEGPLMGMEDKIIHIDRHKRTAKVRLKGFLGEDRVLNFAVEIVDKG